MRMLRTLISVAALLAGASTAMTADGKYRLSLKFSGEARPTSITLQSSSYEQSLEPAEFSAGFVLPDAAFLSEIQSFTLIATFAGRPDTILSFRPLRPNQSTIDKDIYVTPAALPDDYSKAVIAGRKLLKRNPRRVYGVLQDCRSAYFEAGDRRDDQTAFLAMMCAVEAKYSITFADSPRTQKMYAHDKQVINAFFDANNSILAKEAQWSKAANRAGIRYSQLEETVAKAHALRLGDWRHFHDVMQRMESPGFADQRTCDLASRYLDDYAIMATSDKNALRDDTFSVYPNHTTRLDKYRRNSTNPTCS